MADRTIKVLTPATSMSFLTLDEAKTLLGISPTAVTNDAQLQMMIDMNSASIMRICNRIFAREEVIDTWRDIDQGRRVFTSHWPVVEADIGSVQSGGTVLAPGDYELEEASGKISNFNGWTEPVVITYWGGYALPDDAPLPLKQATSLMVRDSKFAASIESIAGIRSISYREKRVQFFDPIKVLGATRPGTAAINPAAAAILVHYTRWEV